MFIEIANLFMNLFAQPMNSIEKVCVDCIKKLNVLVIIKKEEKK